MFVGKKSVNQWNHLCSVFDLEMLKRELRQLIHQSLLQVQGSIKTTFIKKEEKISLALEEVI